MSIFSRIGMLFKSNANAIIDNFEDAEKMLNQAVLEMNEQMVKAKQSVAVAIADEKRLEKQYQAAALNGQEWERKAMMAVKAGDDALAKEALQRKVEADKLTAEYQKQYQLQKDASDKLKNALRGLQNKIDEARRKKDLLIARKKRAEATKTIQATMNGLTDTSAFDTFDRMSQKVDQLEAEAEAQADLANESSDIDAKLAALEAKTGTDDALAALKAKMGLAPATSTAQLENQKININIETSIPVSVNSGRDTDF